MVVWCDDWPVAAMGARPHEPAAVVFANRVVACTPAARAAGVQAGHRRREAQGRCPELVVHERDESREVRAFEPVVRAVETFTPRIELTRAGACTFATRGPSRYFGGDGELADQVVARVDEALEALGWRGAARVGVADGAFAATHAARAAPANAPTKASPTAPGQPASARLIVPAGAARPFLAPFPVHVLDRPELAEGLARLGIATLGDLAELDAPDIVARFGAEGRTAHRLARGLDERPPDAREPPPDLTRTAELDPPAERVDQAAFIAKALADDLFEAMAARGLSCSRVLIGAETEHGEAIERLWRYEGSFTAGAITDRVRWQLEGWLHSPSSRPTSGITLWRLAPDEVVPAHGRQLGFWGGETDADIRAVRALARVQGLLGPDQVRVPEWRGGRGPAEQLTLVPATAVDLIGARPAAQAGWVRAPWPGRLPSPAPAVVHDPPVPVGVLDDRGRPVRVSGRAQVSAVPTQLSIDGGPLLEVVAWAGPWPADERWWDPAAHRRRARFQLQLADGTARLVSLEGGCWWLEATYD
jgi:protein ImuB